MRSEWDNHDRSFCYKTNPAPLWIIAQLLPQILSKSLFVTLLSFLSWPETQRKVVENPEKKKNTLSSSLLLFRILQKNMGS